LDVKATFLRGNDTKDKDVTGKSALKTKSGFNVRTRLEPFSGARAMPGKSKRERVSAKKARGLYYTKGLKAELYSCVRQ
jgi:hypothetical protein